MARVHLDIAEMPLRMTVQAILQADGHRVGGEVWDVAISDAVIHAEALVKCAPTLLLTQVSEVRAAVAAMRQGVYGYALVPLVPGELNVLVKRATSAPRDRAHSDDDPLPTLAEMEARLIREAVRRCKGNQAKAARMLGIARNTLWRKLKQLGEMPD